MRSCNAPTETVARLLRVQKHERDEDNDDDQELKETHTSNHIKTFYFSFSFKMLFACFKQVLFITPLWFFVFQDFMTYSSGIYTRSTAAAESALASARVERSAAGCLYAVHLVLSSE